MFNPEIPQALPQEEAKPVSPDKVLSARADEAEPVSKAEEKPESVADFANRPENMLPGEGDTLPEGGMEALALQWVDQMEAVRQEETREVFRETVASQRGMIHEELLRDEIVNGGTERRGGGEPVFSQDQVATRKSGASEWILEKLSRIPGGKKFFGGLALIAGLSAIPKDAEAGFSSDLRKATGDMVTQSVRNLPREMERQRREQDQRRAKAQRDEERAVRNAEQLKERYAQESQRIVDQYDREDASAERNYDNQQRQLLSGNTRNQDEGLKKKMADRIDVAYHKEKLKAADKAWNGMSRVKEKYVQISTTGVAYQSQVNERFLENLQKVATKATKDLQKFGVEAVTIVPLIGSADPTPVEASRSQGSAEQAPLAGVKAESGPQSKPKSSEVDYSLLSR
jgi:hypothetical protein